ncbi:MAG: pentapeptide repeat-containing protein [Bryobacterales bacterium]|nr:pentapeptide repeat-containing protein [Bryobacterales bacterium]
MDRFILASARPPTPKARDAFRSLTPGATATGPFRHAEIWGPDELESKAGIELDRLADALRLEAGVAARLNEARQEFHNEFLMDVPGLTLAKVYIDLDCGMMKWRELQRQADGRSFSAQEQLGGRVELMATVMQLIQQPDFAEFVVIQGSPGSGKSSFTLRLAQHLADEGFLPLRVRLRDLPVLGDSPLDALARALGCRHERELQLALDSWERDSVLILDGWDELTLLPDQTLRQQVASLMRAVEQGILHRRGRRIPVVVTGRPSASVTNADILNESTPILTIRPLTPEQLETYLGLLDEIYREGAMGGSDYRSISARYRRAWEASDGTPLPDASGEVLGWPHLAHVAYRLLRSVDVKQHQHLLESSTSLLRCLTEFCLKHSRKPSDRVEGPEVKTHLDTESLREYLRHTARFITANKREAVGADDLKQALMGDKDPLQAMAAVDRLLVSFLFRPGNEKAGCEFMHKSLREFLFADWLLNELKVLSINYQTVRQVREAEQRTAHIAALLAASWLSDEEWKHVRHQVEWEVKRGMGSADDPEVFRRDEPPLSLEQWCRIRENLTDLFGNWVLGALVYSDTNGPRAGLGLLENHMFHQAESRLGEALFRLTAIVHAEIAWAVIHADPEQSCWSDEVPVTIAGASHQTRLDNKLEPVRFFSPCKTSQEFETSFRQALARINGASIDLGREVPEGSYLPYLVQWAAGLERVNLSHCDLRQAFFQEARLAGADLSWANLERACLRRADLSRANLAHANLRGCLFEKARLHGANLKDADLTGADFSRAIGLDVMQIKEAAHWAEANWSAELRSRLTDL